MKKSEKAYDTGQKEFLSVIWAVIFERMYLKGSQLMVRTDQDTPSWILTVTDVTDELQQRQLCMLEFDFEVVHWAGVKMTQRTRYPTGPSPDPTFSPRRMRHL